MQNEVDPEGKKNATNNVQVNFSLSKGKLYHFIKCKWTEYVTAYFLESAIEIKESNLEHPQVYW